MGIDSDSGTKQAEGVGLADGTPYRTEVADFVDALAELLKERSLGAIGPSDIARQANSTVALFFECFRDEQGPMGLLASRQIADRLETSAASFTADRWKTASLPEIIRSGVAYLVTLVRPEDPVSEAAAEASLDVEMLMDLRRSSLTYDVELFRRLLHARREEIPDPNSEAAIALTVRQLLVALDREMLLGGDEIDIDELTEMLTEVSLRLLGLRGAGVALAAAAEPDVGEHDPRVVVVLGGAEIVDLVNRACREASLGVRAKGYSTTNDALEAVTAHESPAVFVSWVDNEVESRTLLHRAQSSSLLSGLLTVVFTSGKADELSMAYALGARVAVTQPDDEGGVVRLLNELDQMLGTG